MNRLFGKKALERIKRLVLTVTLVTAMVLAGLPHGGVLPGLAETPYEIEWTEQLGTSTWDNGEDVATDGSGNVYVTGTTEGSLDGNTSAGYSDGFLVKYDSSGNKQWTKQMGWTGWAYIAYGVATDSSGNIYVTGFTYGGLDGNTYAGQADLFLVKFRGFNTQTGTNVQVNLGNGVSLTFENVTGGGTTLVTVSTAPPGGPPSGFMFRGYYYELTTTATYTGPIIVSLPYDEVEITGNEENLKLMHWNGTSWEDVTLWVDTTNNIIYGQVTSLSPFVVAEPVDDTGPQTSNVSAAPNPVAVNTGVTITANVDDLNTGESNIASAEYSLDGGTFVPMSAVDGDFDEVSEDVTANLGSFTEAGVHTVSVRGVDSAGNVGGAETILLAVYDPAAGFVTGGGWINSPEGAYVAEPTLAGKANFGFVSEYQKGATVPTGQTEFQFKVADLNFHSSSYEWLVISGARAQYKGSGTINGTGDYGFMLTAIDGQLNSTGIDKFRIKIWDKATDIVVYDNKLGALDTGDDATELGGGSIVIKK